MIKLTPADLDNKIIETIGQEQWTPFHLTTRLRHDGVDVQDVDVREAIWRLMDHERIELTPERHIRRIGKPAAPTTPLAPSDRPNRGTFQWAKECVADGYTMEIQNHPISCTWELDEYIERGEISTDSRKTTWWISANSRQDPDEANKAYARRQMAWFGEHSIPRLQQELAKAQARVVFWHAKLKP